MHAQADFHNIDTLFSSLALVGQDPSFVNDARFAALVPPNFVSGLTSTEDPAQATLDTIDRDARQSGKVQDAGALVALGTDSPLVAPGIALHTNLRAGARVYSNVRALRNVTVNAARMAFADRDLGTVEVGKIADLTIVRGDPLADVRNAANVEYVVKNGLTYSQAQILAPFQTQQARAAHRRASSRTSARASGTRTSAKPAPTRALTPSRRRHEDEDPGRRGGDVAGAGRPGRFGHQRPVHRQQLHLWRRCQRPELGRRHRDRPERNRHRRRSGAVQGLHGPGGAELRRQPGDRTGQQPGLPLRQPARTHRPPLGQGRDARSEQPRLRRAERPDEDQSLHRTPGQRLPGPEPGRRDQSGGDLGPCRSDLREPVEPLVRVTDLGDGARRPGRLRRRGGPEPDDRRTRDPGRSGLGSRDGAGRRRPESVRRRHTGAAEPLDDRQLPREQLRLLPARADGLRDDHRRRPAHARRPGDSGDGSGFLRVGGLRAAEHRLA
ncbi:MAG: amidohydrolase family protein [Comamonadaceae bacterium]|nr:amidohydrolase family protein [Comamonadaceae bacterium]